MYLIAWLTLSLHSPLRPGSRYAFNIGVELITHIKHMRNIRKKNIYNIDALI